MEHTIRPIIELKEVTKTFTTDGGPLTILEKVTLTVKRGEKVAIVGPSGSGKSTLLSLLGLLDQPTSGTVIIDGTSVESLSEAEQATFRNRHIGFIFQAFELVQAFTARENIAAGLEIGGAQNISEAVNRLLSELGIAARGEALPKTLSGGEKQRVAIGRALVTTPPLILADEPTGSLDRATGEKVLSLLVDVVEKRDATLVVITHDEAVAERMDRVFELRDRRIHERT